LGAAAWLAGRTTFDAVVSRILGLMEAKKHEYLYDIYAIPRRRLRVCVFGH
jgi:hypothetical protein